MTLFVAIEQDAGNRWRATLMGTRQEEVTTQDSHSPASALHKLANMIDTDTTENTDREGN